VVGGTVVLDGAGGAIVVLGDGGAPAVVAGEVELRVADVPDRPARPRWAGAVWKLSSPTSPAAVAPITITGRFMSGGLSGRTADAA